MAMATATNSGRGSGGGTQQHRIVAHLDLDGFYASVERVRLRLPLDAKLGVVQWRFLVAVTPAAKALGVKRGMPPEEARRLIPDIHLVHVQTLNSAGGKAAAEDDAEHEEVQEDDGAGDLDDSAAAGAAEGNDDGDDADECDEATRQAEIRAALAYTDRPRGSMEKISLARYRSASARIMAIFAAACPKCERASIDEAYLDLSDLVSGVLRRCENAVGGIDLRKLRAEFEDVDGSVAYRMSNGELLDVMQTETGGLDLAMWVGASLVWRIRQKVFDELGYTVSAGIAHNRTVAKVSSAKYKPNQQTIVAMTALQSLLAETPLTSLRGMGGKFGKAVAQWSGVQTVAEMHRFSCAQLQTQFGHGSGQWLFRIVRGLDADPVVPNLKYKSMMASRNLGYLADKAQLHSWLSILATELADRVREDHRLFRRRPTQITLHHSLAIEDTPSATATAAATAAATASSSSTTATAPSGNTARSRRPRPRWKSVIRSKPISVQCASTLPTAQVILGLLEELLSRVSPCTPCTRIAAGMTQFVEVAVGASAITSYFANGAQASAPAPLLPSAVSSSVPAQPSSTEVGQQKRGAAVTETTEAEATSCKRARLPPSDLSDDSGSDATAFFQCPKCAQRVALQVRGEHEDFHLALDLQEQFRTQQQADSRHHTEQRARKRETSLQAWLAPGRHTPRSSSSSSSSSSRRNRNR